MDSTSIPAGADLPLIRILQDPDRTIREVVVSDIATTAEGRPIYQILITTRERWVAFRLASRHVEFLGTGVNEHFDAGPRVEFDVPALKGGRYMGYSAQEKDQINIVLIPRVPREEHGRAMHIIRPY